MGSQTESRVMMSHSPITTSSLPGGAKMGGFPLARQASIYSLTLDEFQNTIGEPGKNFGSMNMDEFLKNIWTAEESQAMAAAIGAAGESGNGGSLPRQTSLQRQGSLTLLRTLSRKTVDDVWREIHKESTEGNGNGLPAQTRQVTFGEMTLEDFLVKAGVVREETEHGVGQSVAFGSFRNGLDGDFGGNLAERNGGDRMGIANALGLGFPERVPRNGEVGNNKGGAGGMPGLSLSPTNVLANHAAVDAINLDVFKHQQQQQQHADWLNSHYRSATAAAALAQQQQHQQQQHLLHQQAAAEAAAAVYNAKRAGGNGALIGQGVLGGGLALGGGMGNGALPGGLGPVGGLGNGLGGGFGPQPLALGGGSPTSPLSSDGVGPSHIDNTAISPIPPYGGLDTGMRGRKRGIEGPVEKVVERRQRRMIKNRESAARSRARKQAYTVELEAEVTQLKEENMKLRKQQEEMQERRKKQIFEMVPLSQQLGNKTRVLRRTLTGPW
uniref:TSA: Wollemia nobilis Ref_Wollemi_Transcript_11777_3031 transcribed RNA sequence n=2 Tax=Wollemia nobilis TaxID=56998 RepID=A0A0C9S8B3_9CONI